MEESGAKENFGQGSKNLWFLGFGLYWAWVYLSFNSSTVVQFAHGSDSAITWLHVISGLAGCVVFAAICVAHTHMENSAKADTVLWASAAVASFGSMFYATAVIPDATLSLALGALLPGLTTPLLAVGWGVAYCTLNARAAAGYTAGSFLLSGILYWLISLLAEPLSGIVVAFLPLASVFALVMCPLRSSHPFRLRRAGGKAADEEASVSPSAELRALVLGPFSSRALVGILLTMLVSGGLRTYSGMQAPTVYETPGFVAGSTCIVAALFMVYSAFLPHTSLRLGPLYRLATPLFALAVAALTVFTKSNSAVSFFAASAGSMFIDMLTWLLLIEIARSSRFAALLIFAVGRFTIHLGMAIGELAALAMPTWVVPFCVVSILVLVVVAGFMFSDRDDALVFEPPAEGELAFSDAEDAEAEGEEAQEAAEDANVAMGERIAAVAAEHGLTAREVEVFTLWATGHGAKSIEEKLVLSSATVRTHVRHIYEKCDIHSRAELLDLLEQAV